MFLSETFGYLQALAFVHGAQVIHAPEPIHGRLRWDAMQFLYLNSTLFGILILIVFVVLLVSPI